MILETIIPLMFGGGIVLALQDYIIYGVKHE